MILLPVLQHLLGDILRGAAEDGDLRLVVQFHAHLLQQAVNQTCCLLAGNRLVRAEGVVGIAGNDAVFHQGVYLGLSPVVPQVIGGRGSQCRGGKKRRPKDAAQHGGAYFGRFQNSSLLTNGFPQG